MIAMRIGIVALLHESNTFARQSTNVDSFRQNLLLTGESIRDALVGSHHEVGGFFAGLEANRAEAVPLFAARALPSGTIDAAAFTMLVENLLTAVRTAGSLDGILVAPHGATVSERYRDADGFWLAALRAEVGADVPIIGTLDAHANLSPLMVASCNALLAYRTNPHLDQHERGIEAAQLMVRTVRREIAPVQAAAWPPMAISIDRQCTDEPHLQPLYRAADKLLQHDKVLSNSILLGFPYADVAEMGSSVLVVTDGDRPLAEHLAGDLAETMWSMRQEFAGDFVLVEAALHQWECSTKRICLLDMGDNVGGGSAGDGTELVAAVHARRLGPSFACLYDPESVAACAQASVGSRVRLRVGGKSDCLHGPPLEMDVTVRSLHDGRFRELLPRHGGISEFDQGKTAVISSDAGLTLMLTTRRMVPFSLQQLFSCGLEPRHFRLLIAKGVNAPLAAYREVCDAFIRVNTMGSTCADMSRLTYQHRRRPMFPMEPDAVFIP